MFLHYIMFQMFHIVFRVKHLTETITEHKIIDKGKFFKKTESISDNGLTF